MKNGKPGVTEKNKILEAFIENAPIGIIVIDLTGRIQIANQLVSKFLELNNGEKLPGGTDLLNSVKHITELYTILTSNLNQKSSQSL